jgi:mannose-1-phosphate guanylyltransferase
MWRTPQRGGVVQARGEKGKGAMQRSPRTDHWALVLAGGDGTRLQELTRLIAGTPIPKQYCRIVGDRSLLEATLARTGRFAPLERTLVIVNRDHLEVARDQLLDLPPRSVLIQPRNCDTGPGLLFSLMHLARRQPGATVAVFPSDHYVGDDGGFVSHVERATDIVRALPDKIALLGIRPDRSEVGYGYVEVAQPLPLLREVGMAFHVAAFREKPTPRLARTLIARGGLWNSFVMVFRLERMLCLLQAVMPEEFKYMSALPDDPEVAAARYRELTPWNFSTRFLSRVPEHLVVVRVDDVQWSDWGTRQAIERTLRTLKQKPPWRARRLAPAAA